MLLPLRIRLQVMANNITASTGSVSGLIDGAGGIADTLDITALTDAQTVELGAVASGTAGVTLSVNNVETISANTDIADNTLIGKDAEGIWSVAADANDAGVENNSVRYAGVITEFSGFDVLQGGSEVDEFTATSEGGITSVDGGEGSDDFILSGVSLLGAIDGGVDANNDDTDTITYAAGVTDTLVNVGTNMSGIESLISTSATNTLVAQAGDNKWSIDGANSGSLVNTALNLDTTVDVTDTIDSEIAFSGFGNLTGNEGVDAFTLTHTVAGDGNNITASTGSVSGLIDGAGGVADTLDITALTDAQTVELGAVASGTAGVTLSVNNVETISANTDIADNTLIGKDAEGIWSVAADANDAGVENNSVRYAGVITEFSGFDVLQGGSEVDEFTATSEGGITSVDGGEGSDDFILSGVSLLGAIDGGVDANNDDTDTITYAAGVTDTLVNVGTNMSGIESLISTSATNTLVAQAGDNKWSIDGANSGSLVNTALNLDTTVDVTDTIDSEIAFSGFGNLTGNEGVDAFTLTHTVAGDGNNITASTGSVSGLIDGAGGVRGYIRYYGIN